MTGVQTCALPIFNGRRPRKIMLLGNHEDRIDRTVDEIPELEGTIRDRKSVV